MGKEQLDPSTLLSAAKEKVLEEPPPQQNVKTTTSAPISVTLTEDAESDEELLTQGTGGFGDETLDASEDGIKGWTDVLGIFKLILIILIYGFTFLTMVHLFYGLLQVPTFKGLIAPTDFFTWISEKYEHGIWLDSSVKGLIRNAGLLVTFGLQHSLMSQKFLEDTTLWRKLHFEWKFDRPIYILCTAFALQGIIQLWQVVPVTVWSFPWFQGWHLFFHISSWIILYGTWLMFDYPEMMGFNQVVVSSPTITQKSPQLQLMLRVQRHTGLIPIGIILLAQPHMYLDRFLMAILGIGYMFFSWRSPDCYRYTCQMKDLKREVML